VGLTGVEANVPFVEEAMAVGFHQADARSPQHVSGTSGIST
jgi:hypothetical protein